MSQRLFSCQLLNDRGILFEFIIFYTYITATWQDYSYLDIAILQAMLRPFCQIDHLLLSRSFTIYLPPSIIGSIIALSFQCFYQFQSEQEFPYVSFFPR